MQSAPDWLHQSKFNHGATLDTAPTSLQETSWDCWSRTLGFHSATTLLCLTTPTQKTGTAPAIPHCGCKALPECALCPVRSSSCLSLFSGKFHGSPPWLPPYTAIGSPLELRMPRWDEAQAPQGTGGGHHLPHPTASFMTGKFIRWGKTQADSNVPAGVGKSPAPVQIEPFGKVKPSTKFKHHFFPNKVLFSCSIRLKIPENEL